MKYIIKAARIIRTHLIDYRGGNMQGRELVLHPTGKTVFVHEGIMSEQYDRIATCMPTIGEGPRLTVIRYIYGGSIEVTNKNWIDLYRLAAHVMLDSLIFDLMVAAAGINTDRLVRDVSEACLPCIQGLLEIAVHRSATPHEAFVKLNKWIGSSVMMTVNITLSYTPDPLVDEVCFNLITYIAERRKVDDLIKYRSFRWVTKDNLDKVLKYCSQATLIDALIRPLPASS
jgi:hypothetical protein